MNLPRLFLLANKEGRRQISGTYLLAEKGFSGYDRRMTISCETAELGTDLLPADGLIDEAVDLLKGFADHTRFKILLLLRHDEVCVHRLSDILEISQSAVSHQLRVLRAARLVNYKKRGRHVFDRLADDHVREMLTNVLSHSDEVHE